MFIFDFIKKYKERKSKETKEQLEEQLASIKANEDAAKLRISEYKKSILSKPYPINDNRECCDKCVHFQEGYVSYMPSFYRDSFWLNIDYPKCKLWKR
jgi:hypothetical protein